MKKILILFIFTIALSNCNQFEEDINKNPNRPSEATGAQLIANAMLSLPGLGSSPQGEFLAQYLAETQYVTASLYPVTSSSFYWIYNGPLINLETAINISDKNNEQAVAKILKAYYMWHITDRWGDVPYTEALKGTENFTPIYDTQASIYTNLFDLLDDATAQIEEGTLNNDIIYGGDMDQWKKFAHTIKMLMALRLSEIEPATAKQEFTSALNAGIMESNDDSFLFKHLADANNQNYWFGQIAVDGGQGREWWALTETLVEIMKPFNDPRLEVYGAPTRATDEYIGLPLGETENMDTENFSLLGSDIWEQDAPVYLVTYAQALFGIAEAAKLGWITGGDAVAEANYEMAIEQSLSQWTGSTEKFSDYIGQDGIAYDPATALEQIANQRYIHLFMHGYEAWAEWRRTGYPDNFIEPNGTPVPTRNIYIETEKFNNTASYNEAVQRQFGGEDGLYGLVWWDN